MPTHTHCTSQLYSPHPWESPSRLLACSPPAPAISTSSSSPRPRVPPLAPAVAADVEDGSSVEDAGSSAPMQLEDRTTAAEGGQAVADECQPALAPAAAEEGQQAVAPEEGQPAVALLTVADNGQPAVAPAAAASMAAF